MKLDLVVIGAMKCGTSSLDHYLGLHPEIVMASRKDLGFFAKEEMYAKGLDWYGSLFPGAAKVVGETSVSYTQHPTFSGAPERIKEHAPRARLIYVVRDPVERLISHYVHNVSHGRERRTLEEALATDGHYVATSRYRTQIDRYLEHFPREAILVVAAEDLRTDRAETLGEVFRFLGVDPEFRSAEFDRQFHRSRRKRRVNGFGRLVGRVPVLWRVRDLIPFTGRRIGKPELPDDLRRELMETLRPEVEGLRELTGKRFAAWSV